jgi:nucleoside-diphosphate-sugar epimerase
VTEQQKHTAYPGCYALSKVLEEVMLEQYFIQYDLHGCCLRAPWIMEKDDFKYSLSFGEDVFGGPRWREIVGAARADEYIRTAPCRSCWMPTEFRSGVISFTSAT